MTSVTKAIPADIETRLDGQPIRRILNRMWGKGLADSMEMVDSVIGEGEGRLHFDPSTPEAQRLLFEVGERITRIHETTRQRVARYARIANEQGLSVDELADMIREDRSGAFGRARARMIARTESATIANRGSVLGYKASGRVEEVRVFDGDDCGWKSHDDSDKADGSVRSLEEADRHPTAHPNCVRAFAPVVGRTSRKRPAGSGPLGRSAASVVSGDYNVVMHESENRRQRSLMDRAMGLIERVHGLGDRVGRVTVRLRKDIRSDGEFDPNNMLISVHPDTDSVLTTYLHEFGHYLDYQLIGDKRQFASKRLSPQNDDERLMHRVLEVIRDTPTYQELRSNRFRRIVGEEPDGTRYEWAVEPFIEYVTSRSELFARAYAQYVATRSGDGKALAELLRDNYIEQLELNTQWDDEEFAPIAEAIDALLEGMGWRQ